MTTPTKRPPTIYEALVAKLGNDEANAKLIVRAVNGYAELKEAFKNALHDRESARARADKLAEALRASTTQLRMRGAKANDPCVVNADAALAAYEEAAQ